MKAYAQALMTGTPELLARAQSGERAAFTEIVERHHAELVRISFAVTGDVDAARDAAQLAWIKAWQRLRSVREPARLRTWLIAIAANEARQQVRADKRRRVREIMPVCRGTQAAPQTLQTGSIWPRPWRDSTPTIAAYSRCATSPVSRQTR